MKSEQNHLGGQYLPGPSSLRQAAAYDALSRHTMAVLTLSSRHA